MVTTDDPMNTADDDAERGESADKDLQPSLVRIHLVRLQRIGFKDEVLGASPTVVRRASNRGVSLAPNGEAWDVELDCLKDIIEVFQDSIEPSEDHLKAVKRREDAEALVTVDVMARAYITALADDGIKIVTGELAALRLVQTGTRRDQRDTFAGENPHRPVAPYS